MRYIFKSSSKCLRLHVSDDGRKILEFEIGAVGDESLEGLWPGFRTGEFDNQGSSHAWTWAWTTDGGPFEIWKPGGKYLSLDSLNMFRELYIGKTGLISYGIIAVNSNGSKISLVKDTYPFWDAHLNVTYDGLCEDEDFYPLRMMGRELSKRLRIPFDESIR